MRSDLLPELRPHLADYLHHHDLARMTLVSKEWNDAWTPFLWREIRIQNKTQALAFITRESKQALCRNQRHIRTIWNRSEQLHLTGSKFKKKGENCVPRILEKSGSTLRKLQIGASSCVEKDVEELMRTISGSLVRLRELTLLRRRILQVSPLAMREFLETCSFELEYLSLGWFYSKSSTWEKEAVSDPGSVSGGKPHPNLKCFRFWVSYAHNAEELIAPTVLIPFLQGCPRDLNFDGIMLPSSWEYSSPEITKALSTLTGTRPRYFDGHWDGTEEQLPEAMKDDCFADHMSRLWTTQQGSSSPRDMWKSIRLHHCPSTLPRTFQAILEACQRGLQNLQIYKGHTVLSQDVQSILHSGSALRDLDFTETHPNLDCHIQIANIPRPDVLYDWRDDRIPEGTVGHTGTMEESRALQRAIYTRLGSLVCLEELRLGQGRSASRKTDVVLPDGRTVRFDISQQLTSLEMTLESGLDLLVGLRNVKNLDVEGIEHRIGRKEMR
ncbi:hypothetical protein BGX23_011140 [Mortierella sp. AD031]|nr:hypothetical protein BGX23_011140 [Mortierella sp. AD031]